MCVIVNMVQQPKGVVKVYAPIWFNVKSMSTYSQNTAEEDILYQIFMYLLMKKAVSPLFIHSIIYFHEGAFSFFFSFIFVIEKKSVD